MIKEIVEFMDANEGIENYFLKEELNDIYLVSNKKDTFLAVVDIKSKNQKLIKISDNALKELQKFEIEKLILLENNSKALPRKQLNKDKGVGGAGIFLFSIYYELQDNQIIFYRKKEDIKIEKNDFEKKLISVIQGIKFQLDSGLTYVQNRGSKKIMDIVLQRSYILLSESINDLQFAIHNKQIKEKGNIKLAFFVSDNLIKKFRESYLKRKVFSYDVENNVSEFTSGICNICKQESLLLSAPAFLSNYGVDFSQKVSLGIDFNQLVCPECATKLEKFRYMTENKLTNPFPLFLDNKNLFGKQMSILNSDEKRKNFREIILSIYNTNPKDLKNYYLLNHRSKLSSGTWKLEINDIDYIENFEYVTPFKIINYTDLRNSFKLSDFYSKELSVFQFEKIINELVFENKLQYNYFSDYKDIDITYYNSKNSNSLLKNYLIKYRQNFYDFIYKSYQTSLIDIEFREMILDIVKDNIKHDKNNKEGYSIYENEIKEKLNLLFSIKHYFKGGGEKVEQGEFLKLKEKMHSSLGYWQDKKNEKGELVLKNDGKIEREFINGIDHIENNDKLFAYLCGQIAWFLIDKKKGKEENKNHSDFNAFTDWQTSKLLKEYMCEVHRKYAHALKFDKRYGNAMSMILTYKDDLVMDSVMEYMIVGYFANNQIKYQDNTIEENGDE
ncbi:hypothetical protein [Sulfurospirillum barnesii]|uniref:CRISPR-associated protein, Csh1 family n=1 Tax=Sulfurospirillum barnesii (strain ATCC 700032 / DSM 10660 / SES-3) TaxID=760154 RepID=I3XWD1_SULBS|nr:hypothetical protein [Sulfurospirillum barnesii]AFL68255.1 hypothetical protein Sulba_0954 [Sulfurospirillum barnesii SES-3]